MWRPFFALLAFAAGALLLAALLGGHAWGAGRSLHKHCTYNDDGKHCFCVTDQGKPVMCDDEA